MSWAGSDRLLGRPPERRPVPLLLLLEGSGRGAGAREVALLLLLEALAPPNACCTLDSSCVRLSTDCWRRDSER